MDTPIICTIATEKQGMDELLEAIKTIKNI